MNVLVLRIYDPAECDERGVPLDWERCRTCDGTGKVEAKHRPVYIDSDEFRPCPTCDGHGSLKAAALDHLITFPNDDETIYRREVQGEHRCEDCGHPMSEGTWDPTGDGAFEQSVWRRVAARALRDGREPVYADVVAQRAAVFGLSVYYSPCNEGCRHGGPCRGSYEASPWQAMEPDAGLVSVGEMTGTSAGLVIEASWRPVDVRTLGWPHDLRPEKLAVLCLRCWAARTAERQAAPA